MNHEMPIAMRERHPDWIIHDIEEFQQGNRRVLTIILNNTIAIIDGILRVLRIATDEDIDANRELFYMEMLYGNMTMWYTIVENGEEGIIIHPNLRWYYPIFPYWPVLMYYD